MNQIFIAPRSGPKSKANFEKTIQDGFDFDKIAPYLDKGDREVLSSSKKLYIWGNIPGNKSKWEELSNGDYVFFYQDKKLTWVGLYQYKIHNKKLADFLWTPQDQKSYEYVFFLKDLKEVNIPLDTIINLSDYKRNFIVQGFLKLKSIAIERINNQYGSIQNFINQNSNEISSESIINIQKSNDNEMQLNQILAAIKTKPFVLLAGISGTGKSRLARTIAFRTCTKKELQRDPKKPGNFELIPVRPNWHDSSELIGYVSRINGEKYIITSFLRFLTKAWKSLDVPFILCLDEMNLAPVEQYFAEYLSIIETRQTRDNEIVTDYLLSKKEFENPDLYLQILKELGIEDDSRFTEGISIPSNFIVMGTVNMDETTHSFSRKVLDRAMTFEMNEIDLSIGLGNSKNDWDYPEITTNTSELFGKFTAGREVIVKYDESQKVIDFLQKVNDELEGTPFKVAYRVRDEFLIYCYYASIDQKKSNWLNSALDEMICMKVLSRIEGDEFKTSKAIEGLLKIFSSDYPKSKKKLTEMKVRLQSGYTSFWS